MAYTVGMCPFIHGKLLFARDFLVLGSTMLEGRTCCRGCCFLSMLPLVLRGLANMISCACMSYPGHVCNPSCKEHSTHVRVIDRICRRM